MTAEPFIILGAGGHAAVVADLLLAGGHAVLGCAAPAGQATPFGLPLLGDDAWLAAQPPSTARLANGIGSIGDARVRAKVYDLYVGLGFRFPPLVHPAAIVSGHATLAQGAQVMAGAVVQANTLVGENVIVNTAAVVEHDGRIGRHVHVAPRAVICGDVTVGDFAHVGAGATVLQGLEIGEYAMIAAGAVVVRNTPPRSRLAGVPAKEFGHGR